ncbi:hypothetical protein L1887_54044 [Cichorium endivia]|nr:hypothetical protein L1887_54044 [Cichorium endivia]
MAAALQRQSGRETKMAPTLRTRAAAAVSASSDRPPSPRKPAPLGRVIPANGNPSPLSTHPPSFTSITPPAHSSGWHLASVLFRSAIGAALVTLLFSVTVRLGSFRSHPLVSPRFVSYPPFLISARS